jgi:PAS domain S-box-containing protein
VLIAIERDGTWEGELVQSRRDGAEVVVESRHVLVRDGEHAYVLEANRDVTARKRVEADRLQVLEREAAARADAAASAAQRDRLGEILDGLPSGVFIVSRDLRIEFANLAMRDLIGGADVPGAVPPVYGEAFWFLRADGVPLPIDERPGARALRGERVRHQQLLLERVDGERLPVSVHSAPLRDGGGAPAGAVVILQDVTQLRQAEQLKDDFLALISHEFRTPLTAIHGGAHLLATQGESLDGESRGEVLADVVAESARLDRMLGNILALADVMAGRLRTATEPVLIAPLARRVASEVARRAPRHELVVAAENVPPVEADPNLLEEVLRNLYENALKYAPDGGEVRTTALRSGTSVMIHVADQGIGIAAEHVGSVFERFRRVGGDPTVRGMGLGLYLSRHLVEAMGGRIDVASPGLGLGTTFTVTLPLAGDWSGEEDLANR